MIIEFDKSFEKCIAKLKDKEVKDRLIQIIYSFDEAKSIHDIKNIKKIVGFKSYYRIRIGDYRLGIELVAENTVRFIIMAHRKEIYRKFP